MVKLILILLGLTLSGCAYYEQAVGSASAYYDAKVEAWFKAACTLNQGAMGRISEHRRSIVDAACPPQMKPEIVPKDRS